MRKHPAWQFASPKPEVKHSIFIRKSKGNRCGCGWELFPDVSIEQSRKLAAKALAEIADGNNPQEDRMIQREHARDEFTLRELFGWFIEHHAKPHKKQNSIKEDERLFERYLKPWDNHRISTIKCLDVRTLHAKIGRENGKYAANRMLSLLGTMFAKAIDSDDVALETANPTRGITRFDEKSRDRFLQSDELPKFFESLEQEPSGVMRDFFLILLLTGARRSNTLAMRWNDINLELAVWRIPETKSGDAVAIPLSLDAVQILESRKALAEKSCEWVFPPLVRIPSADTSTTPQKPGNAFVIVRD